ncbi:heat shock protein, putative, partial [Entamoeba dispar SAW760]
MEVYNPLTQENEIFEPEEISGMILKYLSFMAKSKLKNTQISNVIITSPTEFDDKKRNAILAACKLAGIENVGLANEPVAALLEYKRTHNDILSNGSKVVVIDFGGGTLDICCCKIQGNETNTISIGGDKNLGGNDFDSALMELIEKKIYSSELVDKTYFKKRQGMSHCEKEKIIKAINRLKKEAERVKIELSKRIDCEINLSYLLADAYSEDIDIVLSVSRKEFEQVCESKGLYKRLISKIEKSQG